MGEGPAPRPAWWAWVGPLLPLASAFAAATLITLLVMPPAEKWCTSTEFGYLSRIVPALTMLAMLAIGAVIVLFGLLRARLARGGRMAIAVGAGLALGAVIAGRLLEPSCV